MWASLTLSLPAVAQETRLANLAGVLLGKAALTPPLTASPLKNPCNQLIER